MKIVFMGTPDFSVPVLDALIRAGHEVSLVVTQPDRAGNRGKVFFSPVKEYAVQHGLSVFQPEHVNEEASVAKIRDAAPDAMVVVAYGQILRKDILDIPKLGIYNVHASLLPRLRGASPMQHAILEGDEYAGVTIMKVEEGLDSGDMLISGKTEIGRKNFEDIHDELSEIGADLMVKALGMIEEGTAVFTKQDESRATYAGMIRKQDGRIDFSESAEAIDRKIRAFDPWPGAFADLDGKTVKIWSAEPEEAGSSKGTPGTVLSAEGDAIRVAAGDGVLAVRELQMPGKKRVKVRDYLLGHKIEKGARFE